jgi:serine/threonine-protein kinase
MANAATDVFLSYKAEDRARLKLLVEGLEAEGFSVWWDAQIGGGTNWHQDIEQHLESANCVIVAWTKRSIGPDGHFVRDEARRAQRRGVYLPICLDGVEPPLGFGEIQALPLKAWKGSRTDPRFRAIADAVRRRIAGDSSPPQSSHAETPRVSRRAALVGGTGAVVLAAAGGGWLLLKPDSAAASETIAVLPFANLSGDPSQAYFSDGMAEELRSELLRAGLKVVGRTSSEMVRNDDAQSIGRKLGVASILTGSVRRSPSTVRVSAQLVGADDGLERWSQTYDRQAGDALKIQSEIARSVAAALSIQLAGAAEAALTAGETTNAAAHDLYLKAIAVRQSGTDKANYQQALRLFGEAAKRDPRYALALAQQGATLAEYTGSYATDAADFEKASSEALALARRALDIAPGLASARAVLAEILFFRLDFRNSLNEFRKAAEKSLNGDDLSNYAILLGSIGRTDEALDLVDKAIAVDPLNPRVLRVRPYVLLYCRRYDEAASSAAELVDSASGSNVARTRLADSLVMLGRYDAAKAVYEEMPEDDLFRLTGLAIVTARLGDRAASDRTLGRLIEVFGDAASYQLAEIYAQRGELDKAFAALDMALKIRDPGLTLLGVDPFLDPIRNQPRFKAILGRLNLPPANA